MLFPLNITVWVRIESLKNVYWASKVRYNEHTYIKPKQNKDDL
jgi:hypothetical protein